MKKIFVFALIFNFLNAQWSMVNGQSNYSYTVDNPGTEYEAVSIPAVLNLVKQWDQCHTRSSISAIAKLYASVCLYYGTDQTRDFVVQNKRDFFVKHPNYSQRIDDIHVDVFNSATVDVRFTKYVRTDGTGQWKSYPAYLHLIGNTDDWYISWESDDTTDDNIQQRLRRKPPTELYIDNTTPLEAIFNDRNVGKEITTSYWDLVGFEDGATEGPLAAAMISAGTIGARNTINGILRKGDPRQSSNKNNDQRSMGNGQFYYCGGTCSGGEYTARALWIYNAKTRTLEVYPNFSGE